MQTYSGSSDHIKADHLPCESVIFGSSEVMLALRIRCDLAAPTEVPLLIRGESGTGKEILARYIHIHSARASGPFLRINCAAIPGPLLETELFGYERGAFTGANEAKPGKIELAGGGTLFFDEIGEMPLALQSKLLHVLQDGHYCRIGGLETRQSRVRIICATHFDLERAVADGTFRGDLFYRLDVLELRLPPLRERLCDLETLATYHFERISARLKRSVLPIPNGTLERMVCWHWPGNIRELENWISRYIVLGTQEVGHQIVSRQSSQVGNGGPVHLKQMSKEAVIAAERQMILRSLDARHWNKRRVARDLQISYRGLLYKIRAAGITRSDETHHEEGANE
jgi:two-component system response regulator AtoC